MDAGRQKQIQRLNQLEAEIKDVENKMHKLALSIAFTADVIDSQKDKTASEKKDTEVYNRKTPIMLK